jgi:hypothetical protein
MACFGILVLSILSRWLIQFCLYLALTSCIPEISGAFLTTSLLISSSLVYPLTHLTKRTPAASRRGLVIFIKIVSLAVGLFIVQLFVTCPDLVCCCVVLRLAVTLCDVTVVR